MKTQKFMRIVLISIFITATGFAQSKKELREEIKKLKEEVTQKDKEKESVKTQLERISNTDVDKVITADKLPAGVVIGDAGWRIEMNALKYKSDLIGQLGTIWIMDSGNLLQPQGAIILSDYKINPILSNTDKDVIYRSFVSKGTKIDGDGGAPFAKLAATLNTNQYSRFTISVEGTSNIQVQPADLQKIALVTDQLFSMPGIKGVYICTGMHVVKYHSSKYSKSDGVSKITSPVVSIGGEFFAESSEESSEYFVARQLTQLNRQSPKTQSTIAKELTSLTGQNSESIISNESKKYSPEQLLTYILNRKPTFDEIMEFQSEPIKFFDKINSIKDLTDGERLLYETATNKLNELPKEIKSGL